MSSIFMSAKGHRVTNARTCAVSVREGLLPTAIRAAPGKEDHSG
jgi:hypothetical protein